MASEYKQWYATVKYFNGDVENVSVRKIKTREGNHFAPKNYKDFNSNCLYSVKTAMNDVEGREQRYYAFIGRLAENLEELNNNTKRISWPMWPSDINDEPNNTSQDELEKQNKTTHSSIIACREKAIQKQSKRKTANEEYKRFLHTHTIENASQNSLNNVNNNTSRLATRDTDYVNQSITIPELKDLLQQYVLKIEEKINERGKIIEEKIAEVLQHTSENTLIIEEISKKTFSDSSSMDSDVCSKINEKIHLGNGIHCSRANFHAMDIAKNDCDWAIALLIGVFGENAKLMRVYPRKSELQKFPLTFLVLAQHLYRERLKQNKYEGDIEKKVKALPAYLSDRALDLAGARGITASHKRPQKDNDKHKTSKRQKKQTETDALPASTSTFTSSSIAEKDKDKSHDIPPIEDNNV